MGQFRYVTNRTMKNSVGEDKGRIRVIVKQGSDTAEVDYTCPECLFGGHMELEWKRPFSVKCSKCGSLMKLSKLKNEIKKDKKKA
jgi:transcription initiation factor IIE alpha subunit